MADVPVIIEQRILRLDLAALWISNNPILLEGEFGYESDTKNLKIGDGSTNWVNLEYDNGSMPEYTTALLPTPALKNRRRMVFDSTLGVPLYSDGTNWKKFSDNDIVV